MARVVSISTAVPKYRVSQQEVKRFSQALYGDTLPNIDQALRIFDNPSIQHRFFSRSPEWFASNPSFAERNQVYVQEACDLGEEAVRACLEKAGVDPKDVHSFLFVSTTGLATPSIDAHIANRIGMNKHVRRTPIWGLGCAGGVAGFSRAADIAQAFPKSYVLLLTVELCSLTFCKNDASKSNFVATSLFADGAAAVLLAGDDVAGVDGPRIRSMMSTLWPNSLDVMGWDVVNDGLKVVFSKAIPHIIESELRPAIIGFLEKNQLDLDRIDHFILHPGGMKVIESYLSALDISMDSLRYASEVLRSYGNMSSSTVLFVLEKELRDRHRKGSYGLMMALGPGFSLESLLLQWD